MVKHPRANPYFFWWPEELAKEKGEGDVLGEAAVGKEDI